MYEIQVSSKFKRDVKRCNRQQKDMNKFKAVSLLLEAGDPLPDHNKDHVLTGNWQGYRECHIEPDLLLIYRINDTDKIIELARLGSHSELF